MLCGELEVEESQNNRGGHHGCKGEAARKISTKENPIILEEENMNVDEEVFPPGSDNCNCGPHLV